MRSRSCPPLKSRCSARRAPQGCLLAPEQATEWVVGCAVLQWDWVGLGWVWSGQGLAWSPTHGPRFALRTDFSLASSHFTSRFPHPGTLTRSRSLPGRSQCPTPCGGLIVALGVPRGRCKAFCAPFRTWAPLHRRLSCGDPSHWCSSLIESKKGYWKAVARASANCQTVIAR